MIIMYLNTELIIKARITEDTKTTRISFLLLNIGFIKIITTITREDTCFKVADTNNKIDNRLLFSIVYKYAE